MPQGNNMHRFCGGIFLYADLVSTQSVNICPQVLCMGGGAQHTYLKYLLTGNVLAV